MPFYTKKPVTIEAELWDGSIKCLERLMEFCPTVLKLPEIDDGSKRLLITTMEGEMIATLGDYIIKGVKGEFYPCKPDIFEMTYDVSE